MELNNLYNDLPCNLMKIIYFFGILLLISSLGAFFVEGKSVQQSGQIIYVDNRLEEDCIGNYDLGARTCGSQTGLVAYNRIQEASDVAVPGSRVQLRAGVYNDSVTITEGGSTNSLVIYEPYDGEPVTLNFGLLFENW